MLGVSRCLYRRQRHVRSCVFVVLVLLVLTVTSLVFHYHCSTEVSTRQIQDLCELYDRGDIAGNLCNKLCHQQKFIPGRCAGHAWGKRVNIMRCPDCESEHVVLKSKLDMRIWTRDILTFKPDETTEIMIKKTSEFILNSLRSEFNTDLSSHKDVLSFAWRQNINELVESGTCNNEQGCRNRRLLAALKSIMALSTQDEYVSMLVNKASYMPSLIGTCGPAYMVEYTPSLILSGYVLYQGKPDEMFRWPKSVSWHDRAQIALELIDTVTQLENFDPPVFMCDMQALNFGVDSRGHLRILDVDTLEYGRIVPEDRVCHSDKDCGFMTCRGECNLTSNSCSGFPVNNHFQMACRNILLSYIPGFGLLRKPPAIIAGQLQHVLMECSFPTSTPDRPQQQSWKSNEYLRRKMVTLLRSGM